MASLLKKAYEFYVYINEDLSDPRTRNWLLTSSPWGWIAIVAVYLYFCLDAGPKFMKNRKPYNINRLIVVYDLFQIFICSWLAVQGFLYTFPTWYRFYCEPVDYSNEEQPVHVAKLVWTYYMVKLLDLLDTIFFILRRKNSQVTFLHVYHHAGMIVCGYMAVKYFPGGHFAVLGQINCFVHAVMYTYYLITNIDPDYKKSLWWKKYITQLQITQFVLLFIQYFPTFFWEDCDVNYTCRLILTIQCFFLILMFSDFYRKAYTIRKTAD